MFTMLKCGMVIISMMAPQVRNGLPADMLIAERGYWTFQPRKEGKYGLYHLPTGRELIPPTYHDMNENGMVSYYNELHHYSRFYVDWDTQREYRDK